MIIDIDRIAENRFQARPAVAEVEAALRACVKDCRESTIISGVRECYHCGCQFDDGEPHEPDCSYVTAKALIARLDGDAI